MKSVIEVYSDIAKANPTWTTEEEKEFVKKWCKKSTMDKFVNGAMKHNLNLVFSIFNKVAFNKMNEDIFQKAVIALVEALKKYDPKKGYKISTWVTNPIRWAILQAQHAYSKAGTIADDLSSLNHRSGTKLSSVSIDSPIGGDDSGSATIASTLSATSINIDYAISRGIGGEDTDFHQNDMVNGIDGLICKMEEFLNKNEMKVIRGLLDGRNLAQIAVKMKLSRMRLTQISQKAFLKIRESQIAPLLKELI